MQLTDIEILGVEGALHAEHEIGVSCFRLGQFDMQQCQKFLSDKASELVATSGMVAQKQKA